MCACLFVKNWKNCGKILVTIAQQTDDLLVIWITPGSRNFVMDLLSIHMYKALGSRVLFLFNMLLTFPLYNDFV